MNPRYPFVAQRAMHRCEYCHAVEATFNFPFEVEHVIPPGHGGTEDDGNLALSCRACNLYKSDRTDAVDPVTETTVSLSHRRRDRWHERFAVNLATAVSSGSRRSGGLPLSARA